MTAPLVIMEAPQVPLWLLSLLNLQLRPAAVVLLWAPVPQPLQMPAALGLLLLPMPLDWQLRPALLLMLLLGQVTVQTAQ